MIELNLHEKRLAAVLLKLASDKFSLEPREEFDLSKWIPEKYIPEVNKKVLASIGIHHSEYSEDSLSLSTFVADHNLMNWLAQKLELSTVENLADELGIVEKASLRCVLKVWLTNLPTPLEWEIPATERTQVFELIRTAYVHEVPVTVLGLNNSELCIDGRYIASFATVFLP